MASYILFLLLFFFSSCTSVEEPEFRRVDNFRVFNLGLEEIKVGFEMTHFNPNNFALTAKETEADIYLDSVFLGSFRQDSPVEVNRRREFTIVLTGTIPVATFLEMDLNDIHKRQVLIQVKGSTKVGKAGIFVKRQIGYSGRHRLDKIRF